MDVTTALRSRRSTRRFRAEPVPEDVLRAALDDARWAPSWSNTQPYRLAVAQGGVRDRLAADLRRRFEDALHLQRAPTWRKLLALVRGRVPRGDLRVPIDYPEDLQPARRATGFGLYATLGIAREDRAARDVELRRNYDFFGAPVALFVFTHRGLGAYAALDAGVFLQSFLLACHARGLGTCAQGALALWPEPVREAFAVPEAYQLALGVSVGWPEEHPVNSYNPGRAPLETLLLGEAAAPARR